MEVHMQRTQLVRSILATSLVALFSVSPAWAGVEPQPFRTGLFGIMPGQTIRVVSVAYPGGTISPCFMPEVLVSDVRLRDVAGRRP
jgi:hypothetical protein